ncbi:MAG: AsnC family transcriptional regulator [Eubacteriales bacterium]|jgi:DNA-binding Lrp family transcriptional regulator|nr:AsnC family transcriptional regulator [Bacillota bacterium]MBV1727047.1 AsnC family transcriptional regulator [Desulforudis sp.]MDP3049951.1 AsnC family transcriptional regulator [Eubacteriales bacterium]MDQ7789169.1 AsnC family transcriptional regulator [Clostridia bacterium]MBU4533101.1 AsnC family transcriptional regulator [Bacillota bacterium]
MQLDSIDRQLLNLIQKQIPVSSRPYADIGAELGLTEAEVISRIERLKKSHIIRRMGGFFDSRKMGYAGTLCAMRVPEARIEEVAGIINGYYQVTHNYIRDYEYNMWFTVLAPTPEQRNRIIEEIKNRTGIGDLMSLPAKRLFKISVKFDVSEVGHANRE